MGILAATSPRPGRTIERDSRIRARLKLHPGLELLERAGTLGERSTERLEMLWLLLPSPTLPSLYRLLLAEQGWKQGQRSPGKALGKLSPA